MYAFKQAKCFVRFINSFHYKLRITAINHSVASYTKRQTSKTATFLKLPMISRDIILTTSNSSAVQE
jgi:hypothetical protein